MSRKKETYTYGSLKERFALEWRIYALAYVFILIADNIGQIKIPVGKGMFILFPIFYAIILGVLSGPQVLKIVDNRHVKAASKLVVVGICPFIAKLGITAGANIDTILSSGPALLLHGFGNLLGPVLAVPVAVLLGMKREAVGACHSINREYHMALINNIYGPDSAEARGSLSIYIVGGMVGTIYFGLMASLIGMTGWFHPQALGLASGVGAGIMMASASASLCTIYPDWAETISTMASAGETMAGITGIYITMFLAIPLCDKLYTFLEPRLGKFAWNAKREQKEGENK
ncbi:DUF3100 domain-containing protein [Lacrimispora sp. 210928-DFI.3.58]|uniref:DUF3100 domain-containing protein n=1 Tax=Lacrimispora sp. 210928-DFI.3.58 TaxID=2883214 RepID=UPI0015B4833C|nr:DUF3100 domain-containing protein [Lacrimispora sp. 210928-DFI.3.58]MCB7318319.1 DUF3100 domain-containing protein [Lacrimispora sp. 210928-DFI.3.58]